MTLIQARYGTVSGIAVPQAGAAALEEAMQHQSGLVESEPGFGALQVWRPVRSGDPYRMVTWWTDEQAFRSYCIPKHTTPHTPAPPAGRTDPAHRVSTATGASPTEP